MAALSTTYATARHSSCRCTGADLNLPPPPVTALAQARTDVSVIPTSAGNQLAVHRPLRLDERMVALAAAISIDYDFFSRHSYGGGVLTPFFGPPVMPYPGPVGGEAAKAGGPAEGAKGAAGGAAPTDSGAPGGEKPLERDLGSNNGGWFGGSGKQEEDEGEGDWGSSGGGGDDAGGDGGGWG
ncbi:hypothetical protein CHLNCDRAFT_145465 [Chlorella variabilis]|uniref:Phospholipid scramblase n=1 Tax=Chlorella variabilis TaxID=554065 RepID=E1ZEH3_CHLVA|nr:hypothetical protein CHLNCDRAFT_145465 [Chlorella variabilis]EFN55871.1 hypothetical protein CHLNCDRAFT_145465 [Chlorella variabilis]|eukprot:XP_005847973.1 hypothetical protein CHLNCDRAFT_145465 [Chlorella variabilis]